jgi:tetratricopeptide (TPR) repeat protein
MLDTGQIALNREALMLFRQGLAAASSLDYEQAVACYDRVLGIQTDCYEVWYERGLALESCGDYIEAIASYDRALSLKPNSSSACEIWHERGNAFHYGIGDYTQALSCYDQALKLSPDHEQVWHNRGNLLFYGMSLPEEAIACYDHTLAINPDYELCWRNRGNALVELRCYDAAIASYDRALALKPGDSVCWEARNLAAGKSGLPYQQPTTSPVYTTGYADQTFVEGDTDSNIVFASASGVEHEILPIPQGQPLLVIEDDWGKREILLERDRYSIGRDPKSDICLHSQFVSRHHAVLERVTHANETATYQIMDGDLSGKLSTNGLMINGKKCRSTELKSEDAIVFGPKAQATFRMMPAGLKNFC